MSPPEQLPLPESSRPSPDGSEGRKKMGIKGKVFSHARTLWNDIQGNAKWDLIKWITGIIVAVIWGVVVFLRRSGAWQAYGVVGMAIAGLLLLVFLKSRLGKVLAKTLLVISGVLLVLEIIAFFYVRNEKSQSDLKSSSTSPQISNFSNSGVVQTFNNVTFNGTQEIGNTHNTTYNNCIFVCNYVTQVIQEAQIGSIQKSSEAWPTFTNHVIQSQITLGASDYKSAVFHSKTAIQMLAKFGSDLEPADPSLAANLKCALYVTAAYALDETEENPQQAYDLARTAYELQRNDATESTLAVIANNLALHAFKTDHDCLKALKTIRVALNICQSTNFPHTLFKFLPEDAESQWYRNASIFAAICGSLNEAEVYAFQAASANQSKTNLLNLWGVLFRKGYIPKGYSSEASSISVIVIQTNSQKILIRNITNAVGDYLGQTNEGISP